MICIAQIRCAALRSLIPPPHIALSDWIEAHPIAGSRLGVAGARRGYGRRRRD